MQKFVHWEALLQRFAYMNSLTVDEAVPFNQPVWGKSVLPYIRFLLLWHLFNNLHINNCRTVDKAVAWPLNQSQRDQVCSSLR